MAYGNPGKAFRYRVNYADASGVDIPIDGGRQVFDWWSDPATFLDNMAQSGTVVAWRGDNPMRKGVSILLYEWPNPHPEKEIRQVAISNSGLEQKQWRVLAHLGMTAAILAQGAASPATPARDAQKSQALLQEALGLRQANKHAEAAAKLEEALKADDQNAGAWMELTGLHAEGDSIEALTALCQRWFQAMPNNHQAHNVLGSFLEKKEKLAEALAEYKKSLDIEPNQPPTSEALNRVQNKVK